METPVGSPERAGAEIRHHEDGSANVLNINVIIKKRPGLSFLCNKLIFHDRITLRSIILVIKWG